MSDKIAVFQDRSIRRMMVDGVWYFSVIDVVAALTDSVNPRDYWFKMKTRVHSEDGIELSTICRQLKLESSDGKKYATDCADVKALFRIIQSVPSPKAEPFKQWLAQVGYERVREIEDPELAQERMKELYEQKGYPKEWIDKRLRGIAIRQNLTDEWKARGVTKERDFAILTAEISKATFGMTPSDYKAFKGLEQPNQNLRDHMTDLELIFTMLGERMTTELSRQEKPATMSGHKSVARRGGKVAGNARKEAEKTLGRSIISSENDLPKEDKLPGLASDMAKNTDSSDQSDLSDVSDKKLKPTTI